MAYVEAHAGLRDHLKTKKVARLLGIPKVQVIGHMLCLWWWCQEYAQDGNLTPFDADDIAEAAEWEGDAQSFVDALTNCGVKGGAGFLTRNDDGVLLVNDWYQYGGKLFVQRAQSAERMRNMRARNADVTRNNSVTVTHVTPIDKIRIEDNSSSADAVPTALQEPAEVKPQRKPKEPKTSEPSESGEMFTRLCFVLFGHTNTSNGGLTEKQRGLLNKEAKRLREAGATPDDLAQWFKTVWRKEWPGNKNQAPTVSQVVAGVNAWRLKAQERQSTDPNIVDVGDPTGARWIFNTGGER